ncbi:MAG: hypothetical protein H8K03_13795 [Nitrospira sp.]|jgi:hypothetical protein|nr:hypothetical protein [Nitrospira sp. BO4]
MYRLMSVVMCGSLLLAGLVFAAEEQIIQELTANGSRTTRPFTVKDGWEVRWTATNDFSLFLLDAQGQQLEALGNSTGDAAGATYHAKGGTYSLKISSNAHWTVTVVQLP